MLYTLVSVILIFVTMFQGGNDPVIIGYLIAAGLFGIAGAISLSGKGHE